MLEFMKSLSINKKIISLLAGVIVVLMTGTMLTTKNILVTSAEDQTVQRAKSSLKTTYELLDQKYPGEWRLEGDKLYKGDLLMNGNNQIPDHITDLTGATATIFAEETRVATSVRLENGDRATGTVVSDEVKNTVLGNGEDFYGKAQVVGTPYQTGYTPIVNEDGERIGIWYVGVSQAFIQDMVSDSFQTLLVVGLGIALLALVAGYFFSRGISNQITRVIEALRKSSREVSSASEQLSSSSQKLAEGSSEQASSLEETSSSLEEMSSQTKQNADNAGQANTAVKNVASQVENGTEAMQRMSQAMEEIKSNASETSRIIKTIDDIAFQTNLLALNAAVEAARAGEAGKGFAVVAEEVRSMAARTTESTEVIEQRIEQLQKQAQDGGAASQAQALKEEGQEKVATLRTALDELGGGDGRSMEHHAQILDSVRQGSTAVQNRVSELLAGLQFQDITRQRLEQVEQVLERESAQLADMAAWLRAPAAGLPAEKLSSELVYNEYVMDSQRRVHSRSQGSGGAEADTAAPKVELF